MKKKIVTFGEVMGRICPPGFKRLRQSLPGQLELTFAGAEANVAASIAILGGESRFVSVLPENGIADACVDTLRGLGMDTSGILRTATGRLGLYFVEKGANQRPSQVIYDRDHSAFSMTPSSNYNWPELLRDTSWLHVTGITPALSENAFQASLEAVKQASQRGITVSCDLNFRNKLWQWSEGKTAKQLAGECMRQLLPHVSVLIGNEGDATDVLSIDVRDSNVEHGSLAIEHYPDVAKEVVNQYPNIEKVAITLRQSLSASHNNWGAMLYTRDGEAYFAPVDKDGAYAPYPIKSMVDRVGAGDSFAAGLIFALTDTGLSEPEKALRFATAFSCLAHSIEGDFNYTSRGEVEKLMSGNVSGRISR